MDNGFPDLFTQINHTVEKVLNRKNFEDLKHTITIEMQQAAENTRRAFHTDHAPTQPPPRPQPQPKPQEKPVYGGMVKPRRAYPLSQGFVSSLFAGFGIAGASLCGLTALVFVAITAINFLPSMIVLTALFGCLSAVFGVMGGFGFARRRLLRCCAQYKQIIGNRRFCQIEELAGAAAQSPAAVVKGLKRMMQLRLFEQGFFDRNETCFMLDYETYQQYLRAAQQYEARRQEESVSGDHPAGLQEMKKQGAAYLQKIKQLNTALPGEEVSRKLDQLEEVASKIFLYVEQHPEKLPQIRKFMCYYLPTTLKLMETYRELEQHGIETVEARQTKQEIEDGLDTINKSFENLLSKLLENDLIDVSASFSAMEVMLAQEGLTGGGDFGNIQTK